MHDTVYEARFGFTSSLVEMGANIVLTNQCVGKKQCRFSGMQFLHSAVINGPTRLRGIDCQIPDLRAGFAYIVAALVAQETSNVSGVGVMERGYADVTGKLASLGAQVTVTGGEPAS
jgi:UDP-N-acetylglucosamine 1-carboxyvinyltransferase